MAVSLGAPLTATAHETAPDVNDTRRRRTGESYFSLNSALIDEPSVVVTLTW